MTILAVAAISISLTTCGDTVQFKEGEYKQGEIVTQIVPTLPTSDCWQVWPGDSTAKFAAIRGDDSAGTFVIVMRTTDSNWTNGDLNHDKKTTVLDLTKAIQKFKRWIWGQ